MNDIWWVLVLAIPIACLLFVLIVDNYYLRRRVKRLRADLDKVNLRCEATLRDYDPIECEECHLPGDCPLCGAR